MVSEAGVGAAWEVGSLGAAEPTEPEVPAIVGDTLRGTVGGGGLQHHDLHLLAGVALDRGHAALPFARGPHADVRQGQLAAGGRRLREALLGPGPLPSGHPQAPGPEPGGSELQVPLRLRGVREASPYSLCSDWPSSVACLGFTAPLFIVEIRPLWQVYWRDEVSQHSEESLHILKALKKCQA